MGVLLAGLFVGPGWYCVVIVTLVSVFLGRVFQEKITCFESYGLLFRSHLSGMLWLFCMGRPLRGNCGIQMRKWRTPTKVEIQTHILLFEVVLCHDFVQCYRFYGLS
jgi:hypothetical protein